MTTIEQIEATGRILSKVRSYFSSNESKVFLWMNTKNPLLGNVSPMDMINAGRERKLERVIDNCLEGNFP